MALDARTSALWAQGLALSQYISYMYIFARTHNHQYIGEVIYLLYCLVVIGIRVMVVFQTRLTGAFDSVKFKHMVTSIHQALRFREFCCSGSQLQNRALCKPSFEPNSIKSQKKVKTYNGKSVDIYQT